MLSFSHSSQKWVIMAKKDKWKIQRYE
jgi:hypothetical protein